MKSATVLILVLWLRGSAAGDDGLRWSQSVFDFGTVPVGARLAAHATLTNDGKQRWRLERTSSTCGCASAGNEDGAGELHTNGFELGPGDSIEISVRVQPKRVGKTGGAVFLKLKEVTAADTPAEVSMGLDVRVVGTRPVELKNQEIDLGLMSLGPSAPVFHDIKLADERPFRIIGVRTSPQSVIAEFSPSQDSTAQWKLRLKPVSGARRGAFGQDVLIDIEIDGRSAVALVRVSGTITTDLSFSPDPVILLPDQKSVVEIRSATDLPFQLKAIENCPAWIRAEREGRNDSHKVTLRWLSDSPRQQGVGEIEVTVLSHPEKLIRIPFQCLRPSPDSSIPPP